MNYQFNLCLFFNVSSGAYHLGLKGVNLQLKLWLMSLLMGWLTCLWRKLVKELQNANF